jgi:lysozyme
MRADNFLTISILNAVILLVMAISQSVHAQSGLGDRSPVAFSGMSPDKAPVQGMDAARFQNEIDWRRVARSGIKFAFLKATEGGDLLDPSFRTNWRKSKRAGVARGAYHFYYFCTSPQVQARWFIRNVPKSRGALPPVLDMEWNPLSPTCQRRPNGATVRKEMKVWLDLVERHYGQRPLIYTTPGFYKDTGLSRLKGYEFWLRSTAKTPREAFPGQSWRFWQFTATGTIPGIDGDVDRNIFNGSQAQWDAWKGARAR